MVDNIHRVCVSQWRKWSEVSQNTFNDLYSYIRDNQQQMVHPDAQSIPEYQWDTTAWNAAFVAAGIVNGENPQDMEVIVINDR